MGDNDDSSSTVLNWGRSSISRQVQWPLQAPDDTYNLIPFTGIVVIKHSGMEDIHAFHSVTHHHCDHSLFEGASLCCSTQSGGLFNVTFILDRQSRWCYEREFIFGRLKCVTDQKSISYVPF